MAVGKLAIVAQEIHGWIAHAIVTSKAWPN